MKASLIFIYQCIPMKFHMHLHLFRATSAGLHFVWGEETPHESLIQIIRQILECSFLENQQKELQNMAFFSWWMENNVTFSGEKKSVSVAFLKFETFDVQNRCVPYINIYPLFLLDPEAILPLALNRCFANAEAPMKLTIKSWHESLNKNKFKSIPRRKQTKMFMILIDDNVSKKQR